MFTNIFYKVKFSIEPCVLPISQLINLPHQVLIDFGHRNEIVNDISKEKLILYFKLLQRGFIFIWLKDYSIKYKTPKTENLEHILENWRTKKGDPKTRTFVVFKGFQSDSFFSKLKRMFFGEKMYEHIKPGANFFINDLLDNDIEQFFENLDIGVDFNFRMFDQNHFLGNILDYIESLEVKVTKGRQAKELFEHIKELIDKKEFFPTDIKIVVPLEDYIDKKNYYFDIIYQLHQKQFLNIKEIYLHEQKVIFVINSIYNFKEDILNEITSFEERLNFIDGNLSFDGNLLLKGKKAGNKNYELIDIIVFGIKNHKNKEVSYNDLKQIFSLNEKKYPYFFKALNKKGVLESLNKKIKESKKKEIRIGYQKEKDDLLNKIFNLEFFNSSLGKESNEKIEFILKKDTVGIDIKAN